MERDEEARSRPLGPAFTRFRPGFEVEAGTRGPLRLSHPSALTFRSPGRAGAGARGGAFLLGPCWCSFLHQDGFLTIRSSLASIQDAGLGHLDPTRGAIVPREGWGSQCDIALPPNMRMPEVQSWS